MPIIFFGSMFIYLDFMNVAPTDLGIIEFIFICLALSTFFLLYIKFITSKSKYHITPLDLPLAFLLLWMIGNIIIGKIFDVKVGAWFRQIAPFLGLILFFLLKEVISDFQDIKIITSLFIIAAGICVIKIIFGVLSVGFLFSVKEAIALRAEHEDIIFGPLIFALIGYLTGYLAASPRRHFFLTSILFISALAHFFIFSKAVIINYIIMVFAYLWISYKTSLFSKKLIKQFALFWGFFMALSLFIVFSSNNLTNTTLTIIETYFFRFSDTRTYSNRSEELEKVAKDFGETYYLGKGLGSQLILSKNKNNRVIVKSQSYTHNILIYILFTMGIPGIVIFCWLSWNTWRFTVYTRKKLINNEMIAVFYGYITSLIAVIVYVQFESVYRHFIFSLYIAMVLAVMVRISLIADLEKLSVKDFAYNKEFYLKKAGA